MSINFTALALLLLIYAGIKEAFDRAGITGF